MTTERTSLIWALMCIGIGLWMLRRQRDKTRYNVVLIALIILITFVLLLGRGWSVIQ